jgi:hypothetical protein
MLGVNGRRRGRRRYRGRLPLDFAAVFFPVAVVGDGGGAGFEGLGDEEAVEGIAVVEGKLRKACQVGWFDGKEREAVEMLEVVSEVLY